MPQTSKVGIIGLGYIGLPTAVTFASHGVSVFGVDVSQLVVETIAQGRPHFHEPGLEAALELCLCTGRLRVGVTPEPCDAFILTVPTPFKDNHIPDLSYVEAAAESIAPVLAASNLVVLESTAPVGTTELVAAQLARLRSDLTFPTADNIPHQVHVAHCPERVLPGQILQELANNARVIGGVCPCCTSHAVELYQRFAKGPCLPTTSRAAEMVKLSENAFRDVNIAFANELSVIADHLDVDVNEVIRLANSHPRVRILRPGAGVGGHCIAVDPWFIIHSAPEQSNLIHTARLVNESKPEWVVNKVLAAYKALRHPIVGCLGLAYKADVADVRESPAVAVIELLHRAAINPILVHDPFVDKLPETIRKPGVQCVGFEQLLNQANVLVLLTDHSMYLSLDVKSHADIIFVDPSGAWQVRGA